MKVIIACKNYLVSRGGLSENRYIQLGYLTLRDFSNNNGPNMAAGLAYFALFSLFPLSLIFMALIGLFLVDQDDQIKFVNTLQGFIPVSGEYLSETIGGVVENRGPISLIGFVGLSWSGLAVFSAVRRGINHAWGIGNTPHAVKGRVTDLLMLIGMGLGAIVIFILSAKLFEIPKLGDWLSLVGGGIPGKTIVSLLSLSVSFLVLLLICKYLPQRKVAWGDVWLGALSGGIGLECGKNAFAWYVSNFGNFNVVYGSLGALMAVLLWVYLAATILLLTAHFSAVYCRVIGSEAGKP